MRSFVLRFAILAALALPGAAAAQGTCSGGNAQSLDACRKGSDIIAFMAPQVGVGLTGGNVLLGRETALGGFPRVSVALRANLFNGDVPDGDNINAGEARPLATNTILLGAPQLDVGVGVFAGAERADGLRIGAIDLLASAVYLPDVDAGGGIEIATDGGNTAFGFGARVEVVNEGKNRPSLTAAVMRRSMPTLQVDVRLSNARFQATDIDLTSTSWRVAAAKRFGFLGFAAGLGQDFFEESADYGASGSAGSFSFASTGSHAYDFDRFALFANANLYLGPATLGLEVGQSGSTDIATTNRFTTEPGKALPFYSVSLRIGF
jgi:hypothetical protein